MVASLAAFLLLYAAYTFYVPVYALAATPVLIVCALAAVEVIGITPGARAALYAAMLCVTVMTLPQLSSARDEWELPTGTLRQIDRQLAALDHTPAVVLFHFDPERDTPHVEPVYNTGVAWPDDAPVIRAHDLGPRDGELIRYYAGRQPGRVYYLFDRKDGTFTRLGTATDAERALAPSDEPGRR
jgi:hypothetical protein